MNTLMNFDNLILTNSMTEVSPKSTVKIVT